MKHNVKENISSSFHKSISEIVKKSEKDLLKRTCSGLSFFEDFRSTPTRSKLTVSSADSCLCHPMAKRLPNLRTQQCMPRIKISYCLETFVKGLKSAFLILQLRLWINVIVLFLNSAISLFRLLFEKILRPNSDFHTEGPRLPKDCPSAYFYAGIKPGCLVCTAFEPRRSFRPRPPRDSRDSLFMIESAWGSQVTATSRVDK
ncbi:hypothetical protein CEXT_391131 [Caerostris extrusa]|uniref:Uncharacterized protein n=1 Tax=Caerostris extrusa TaxID=172846 RepID=A0AAV4Y5I0_CAEEX|nr:hypothetical protein CEXT_391131 [Caerostris extrusa]